MKLRTTAAPAAARADATSAAPSPGARPRKRTRRAAPKSARGRKRTRPLKRYGKRASAQRPHDARRGAPRPRPIEPVERFERVEPVESASAETAYERGYADGLFDGGEKLLEINQSGDVLIPELSVERAIAAGMEALRASKVGYPLLGTEEVYRRLDEAIRERRGLAFVRLGDGELLTLAQDTVYPADRIREMASFLSYAGVDVPDLVARDELASAVRYASIVGVPLSRRPHFQPLLFRVLKAHGIELQSLQMTTSTMNYAMYEQHMWSRLWQGRTVLVVGNLAEPLAELLAAQGVAVAGAVSPVRGCADIARVVAAAAAYEFDLALVSAGIPAIPICVHLAGITGKVTVDFGHLANRMTGIAPHARG